MHVPAAKRITRLLPALGEQSAPEYLLRAALIPIAAIVLILRLYRLDGAPSDIYTDITIILEYVRYILNGTWPFYFNDSAGPLYHYLIAPVVLVLGLNYLTLKITSVVVSLGVLAITYLLARELGLSRLTATLAVLLAGCGSWLLVFSRLGNSQILTPLLAAALFYFLARYVDRLQRRDLLLAATLAALGLYTYPQTFFLAPAALVPLIWYAWRQRVPRRSLLEFLATLLVLALPFAFLVWQHPSQVFGSYIAGKFQGNLLLKLITVWPVNLVRSLLMLNVRGDVVFRSNPEALPHLDVLTGIFFLLGLATLLWQRRSRQLWFLVWPFLFLQLPSTLVLNYPVEVPSASRTLLIAPFVYIMAAEGLAQAAGLLPRRWLRAAFLIVYLLAIPILNAQRYFGPYLDGLPNHNFSYARAVAAAIDAAPPGAAVTVYSCCWGEWDTPDWDSIRYALARSRDIAFHQLGEFDCQALRTTVGPQFIITRPDLPTFTAALQTCLPNATRTDFPDPRGQTVYVSFISP